MAAACFANFYYGLIKWYNFIWDLRDIRVDDYPLMHSPWPTLVLVIAYVACSLKLGPNLMKNREPFNIRKQVVLFNLFMVFCNVYLHYQWWTLGWGTDYSWTCQPVDRSNSPRALNTVFHCFLFLMLKYLDWIDTLFFITRKKFDHVSGLHVYHHAVMPIFIWIMVRYFPGGHITFIILLNTAVHVVMHFYYFISALGREYQKYLWWKRYLTILQLGQFVVGTLHAFQILFLYDCEPFLRQKWTYIFLTQPFLFFYLFYKFYQKVYSKKKSTSSIKVKNN